MRIGSLFSGIGGLEWGLERAGVGHVVWQVEKEPFCRKVLAKHWPNAQRFDDVCTVGAHNLAPVEVICGGSPCQDISFAGRGAGLDGERSGLFFEYMRIVRELQPRVVVIENVAALLVRGLDRVLGALAESGYDAVWDCIPASAVGAPHRRDRLFVVACRASAGREARRADVVENESDRWSRTEWLAARGSEQLADTHDQGPQRHGGHERVDGAEGWDCARRYGASVGPVADGRHAPAESGMGGDADGVPAGLVRTAFGRAISAPREARWPSRPGEPQHPWEPSRTARDVKDRTAQLRAFGNAVVPAVGEVIGRVVTDVLR